MERSFTLAAVCVSTGDSRSIPPPPGTTERLSVKYENKKDGGWYILYTCVCAYNVDKPESGGVCDGWKKLWAAGICTHTQMCVWRWGWNGNAFDIYIRFLRDGKWVSLSLLDSPSVSRTCLSCRRRDRGLWWEPGAAFDVRPLVYNVDITPFSLDNNYAHSKLSYLGFFFLK